MKKAIFFDRDGTLVEEADYLGRVEDMKLIPGAVEAVKKLAEAGYLIVVVTNQSGVARGYFDLETVDELNNELARWFAAEGVRIDRFYVCDHHPDHTGQCDCRKPAPGLLLKAEREFGIDLGNSWMVGDKVADVEAGEAAGCRTCLVRTGYGVDSEKGLGESGTMPDIFADDVGEFARKVIDE